MKSALNHKIKIKVVINMKRDSIKSSNLNSIGYDLSSRTLEIEFNNGAIYLYFSVPQTIYNNLMRASSHGRYFNRNIKGKYKYKKIE